MSSPIVASTLQSALLGAFSGILAQGITAYRAEKPIVIDWISVMQFVLFTIVSTPPNVLWQEFIETTFPAHPARENSKKLSAAEKSNGVDKKANEADKKSKDATSRDGALSYKNTAIKFLLDQTLGATVNTLLYSTFIRSLRAATAHAPPAMSFVKAVDWWMAAGAVDFSAVNFHQVWLAAQDEFWPIVTAGWRLWPFVSLINFTLIKSVQGRNLFGAVAGVAWGIYICIATAD